MSFDQELATSLSNQYRDYASSLPFAERAILESCLLRCTSVAAARNVTLWGTQGTVKRNILNRNLGADEYKLRLAVVEGLLQLRPINSPQKVVTKEASPGLLGVIFARYLLEPYVVGALKRVEIFDDSWRIMYDADSSSDEGEITDEDLDEFEGVVQAQ